jgi:putative transposase
MSEDIFTLCHLAKNLYNAANYITRQAFFAGAAIPTAYTLIPHMTKDNHPDYRALPVQTAQQTLRLLDKDWTSFSA